MNAPSLSELNKTCNMDPNVITRYYKLKLIKDFMNIRYQNPKMKIRDSKSTRHVNFYNTETKK